MDENTAKLYGKITLLEFLLEIAYANQFQGRVRELEAFGDDLIAKIRYRSKAPGSSEAALSVQAATINAAEVFLRNVKARAKDSG